MRLLGAGVRLRVAAVAAENALPRRPRDLEKYLTPTAQEVFDSARHAGPSQSRYTSSDLNDVRFNISQ